MIMCIDCNIPEKDCNCGNRDAESVRLSGCYVPFERENRYLIIKRADLERVRSIINNEHLQSLQIILDYIEANRIARGKQPLQAVVVEHDWPEFEPTWDAIKRRMEGA